MELRTGSEEKFSDGCVHKQLKVHGLLLLAIPDRCCLRD